MRAAEAGIPGTRTPVAFSDTKHYGAPVQIDVMESGNGQIEIPGVSDKTPDTVIYLTRPTVNAGGRWSVEALDTPEINGLKALTIDELGAKIADTLGISGRVSIYDVERPRAKGSHAFDYVAKTAPAEAPAQLSNEQIDRYVKQHRLNPEAAQRMRDSFRNAAGGSATEATTPAEQAPRSTPFNPRVADGGNLPARREGETDGMYSVRVAPSDTAAENLLKGYSIAGLKAMARDAGIPGTASMSKTKLIEALMLPRRRYWDSIAVEQQR